MKQLQERLKAGAKWKDSGLVFTTYRSPHRLRVRHRVDSMRVETRLPGGPAVTTPGKHVGARRPWSFRTVGGGLHPRNVLRVLHGLLEGAKLRALRFHDLRHSAASLLIAEGVELVESRGYSGLPSARNRGSLFASAETDGV